MKIIVDENIPYGVEAFGTLGDVEQQPGREMTRESIRDAGILIIRSVTPIGEELLAGSKVKFVGTCTIGMDHIDQAYLRENKIHFASAPGSNANSVAEYVTASLLLLAQRQGIELEGKSIGIVGVGNVGTQVARKARALGMRVLLNDPPLQRETGDTNYLPIEDLLGADVLTFHVPLTNLGQDRTYHLANRMFIARMKHKGILINSARGSVVESPAVLEAINDGHMAEVVLDVWENEPDIDAELLSKVSIGTPHIAGYSFDGKVGGTLMVYRALCDLLGEPADWHPDDILPEPEHAVLEIDASGREEEEILREAVLTVYNIERDDADLCKMLDLPAEERGAYFDGLRRDYPERREFPNACIRLQNAPPKLAKKLSYLGFEVQSL